LSVFSIPCDSPVKITSPGGFSLGANFYYKYNFSSGIMLLEFSTPFYVCK
jgi:hypothetical protein